MAVCEDEATFRSAIADMKRLLPFALLAARVPPVLRLLNREDVQVKLFGLLRSLEDRAAWVRRTLRRR